MTATSEDLAKRALEDAEEKALRQGDAIGTKTVDQAKNVTWAVVGVGLLGIGVWYAVKKGWI